MIFGGSCNFLFEQLEDIPARVRNNNCEDCIIALHHMNSLWRSYDRFQYLWYISDIYLYLFDFARPFVLLVGFFRNDTVLIVCIFLSFTARYFSFLFHSYGFLCFLLRFYLIRKTRGRFILLFFLRVLSACFYTCIALLLSRLIFLYFI